MGVSLKTAAALQQRLGVGEQATQQLRVLCMEPFVQPPSVQVHHDTHTALDAPTSSHHMHLRFQSEKGT